MTNHLAFLQSIYTACSVIRISLRFCMHFFTWKQLFLMLCQVKLFSSIVRTSSVAGLFQRASNLDSGSNDGNLVLLIFPQTDNSCSKDFVPTTNLTAPEVITLLGDMWLLPALYLKCSNKKSTVRAICISWLREHYYKVFF